MQTGAAAGPPGSETYDFDDYLAALGADWYEEDSLLRSWLGRSHPSDGEIALVQRFGRAAAGRYREVAERVERAENLPYLEAPDPYNRRAVEVVIPAETRTTLGEVHGSGIWRQDTDDRLRYAIVYLLNQNSEFGVACSTACTDGMARILRALGDDERSRAVVDRLEGATPESWIHGAQFVTEIQGGSDAATNAVRAVPAEDGLYALYGPKWFCSNPTADYWLVTGRLDGSAPGHSGVSLFCVPRERDGAASGFVFRRLKDKLGTRALPTAEIDFEGALGWPVGPLDQGLRNMVAVVLTTSRIHCVLGAAAAVRRASREAHAYAAFRRAFGKRLEELPLIAASLARVSDAADRLAAGAFATVDTWIGAMQSETSDARRSWARVLVSVAKAISTRASNGHVYEAMMTFGGNGIEERFSALPRLWRDAAILESWEGPHTLLLMQALGDMSRLGVAGRELEFLTLGLGHRAGDHAAELAGILAAPERDDSILAWADLAPRIYKSFQERALSELSALPP